MDQPPHATIVIPSYNRPERLRDCLRACIEQTGTAFEVVVVDDGSPTPLAPICAEFGAQVRTVRQSNAGPATARNVGAREARGKFVAFTDDDCRPRPDWLSGLMAAHRGDPARLVGGHVENGLPANRFAAASQSLCDYLYDYFGAQAGRMPFFTSNNIGCDRARFLEIGGFDETFPLAAAEDREFGLRWAESGGSLAFVPDAIVDHYHALSLARFWRQHANYGRGARHLHRVLDARGSDQPRREPIGFYIGLMSHPVRTGGIRNLDQAALMMLSQIAMVRGYAEESRSRKDR